MIESHREIAPFTEVEMKPSFDEARFLSSAIRGNHIIDRRLFMEMLRIPEPVMAVVESLDRCSFLRADGNYPADIEEPQAIGYDQMMSATWIVAWQAALLEVKQGHKILEIGGGSGLLATVLAKLGAEVHAIEYVQELAIAAARKVTGNVKIYWGNGFLGIPQEAPFDAVIVSCLVPHPACFIALISQLKEGARIIVPMETELHSGGVMVRATRTAGGLGSVTVPGPEVGFVPARGYLKNLLPQLITR